jgi:hypothetical protein
MSVPPILLRAAAAFPIIALALTVAATRADAGGSKSISEWVTCGGTTDQTAGVTAAFAAARNGAFTLVVDCPVHLNSGLAVDRGIFIDNGTTVEFTGAGKFFVDNLFHPAFVIANSSNISLLDWNVEWDGSVPINPNFGGYELNGTFIAAPGTVQPAAAFNDIVLTDWLASNRGIRFEEGTGWVKSIWVGGINPAAVFFITGETSDVVISGLKLYVPANAGGNAFLPMAFSVSPNWKSSQTVTPGTPETTQTAAVPQWLTFSNIYLDGILMGWQGSLQDSTFENITAQRYGDLQDAGGNNVGGTGKWFPPPHLFYLNTQAADPGLDNSNIHFTSVYDIGPRIGRARDRGGSDSQSGYANSLKLGCTNCSVEYYASSRPDGFLDLLPSSGLTIETVFVAFDSRFLNSLYPAGIRFPDSGYSNVTFENVTMTDTAASTIQGPIGNATDAANKALVFSNVQVDMANWAGPDLPLPTVSGATNDIDLNFTMSGQLTKASYLQKGALDVVVKNTPSTVNSGASTLLAWTASAASGCSASGAWSGSVGTSGSRLVKLSGAGSYAFTLECRNSADSSSTTLSVIAD